MRLYRPLPILVVAMAALIPGLLSCRSIHRKESPKPAAEVAFPAHPTGARNDIYGYLKLNDPNQALAHLDPWLTTVNPDLNADQLRQSLASNKYNFKDLKSGANVATFFFKPVNILKRPFASLVPVPADSESASALKDPLGNQVAPRNGYTVFARDDEYLKLATDAFDTLRTITDEPVASDLTAFFNVAPVMEQYGAAMRAQLMTAQALLGQTAANDKQNSAATQNLQRILGAELKMLLNGLEQTRDTSLGLGFQPDYLSLSLFVRGKAGSTLERYLQSPTVNASDLSCFLDPSDYFVMQQNITYTVELMNFWSGFVTEMAGNDNPDELAAFRADLQDLAKIGHLSCATGMNNGAQGQLVYQMVTRCADNREFIKFYENKLPRLINQGVIHRFYESMGVKVSLEDTSPRRWWPRHKLIRYHLKYEFTPSMPAAQQEHLRKMLGDPVLEVTTKDGLVLMTLNQPVKELAGRIGRKDLQPIAAVRNNPIGAVAYGNVDIPRMINAMRATLPPDEAATLPTLATDAAPLGFTLYTQGGEGWFHMDVPRDLFRALRDGIKTVEDAAQKNK